jgi:hypothetical protein
MCSRVLIVPGKDVFNQHIATVAKPPQNARFLGRHNASNARQPKSSCYLPYANRTRARYCDSVQRG